MYIKFEIHIFVPPPLTLFIFFSPTAIYYNKGVHAAAAGEKFSAFFVAILYILSRKGKIYAYFLQIGEKIFIFPPFFIPFQSGGGVKQKNIHPCKTYYLNLTNIIHYIIHMNFWPFWFERILHLFFFPVSNFREFILHPSWISRIYSQSPALVKPLRSSCSSIVLLFS